MLQVINCFIKYVGYITLYIFFKTQENLFVFSTLTSIL